jgi:hypothetical protein
MSFPLMDTLNSAMFRLSLDELVDLERKRRTGMSRTEILSNIYCPAATPPTPQKFLYLPNDQPGGKILIFLKLSTAMVVTDCDENSSDF